MTVDLILPRVANTVYRLKDKTYVGGNCDSTNTNSSCIPVVLTIAPGVTVLAQQASSALFIRRGSRISAVGTASEPIVFTSQSQLGGSTDDGTSGLWYGVALLGRAPIGECLDGAGRPECDMPWGYYGPGAGLQETTATTYGGKTSDDNSGVMRYVQIRYSTYGLMAGGVGGRTTIDHIQVHNAASVSVLTNGGRPNFRYMALTGGPGIEANHGYRGSFQYVVGVQGDLTVAYAAAHIDRPEGTFNNTGSLPRTYVRIANATFVLTRATVSTDPYDLSSLYIEGGADAAIVNTLLLTKQNCLRVTNGATLEQPSNLGAGTRDELGPAVFLSVNMQCGQAPFVAGSQVTVPMIQSAFGSGTNGNNANYTPSLVNLFVNGPIETAALVSDPTPYNTDPFGDPITGQPNLLTTSTYVGAISGTNDTSFQGWTCNAGFFTFGGSGGSCNVMPPS